MPNARPRIQKFDRTHDERRGALNFLRAVFLILLVVFTALLIVTDSTLPGGSGRLEWWWWLAVPGVGIFFSGVIALDVLTPKRKLSTVSAIFFGLIVGVIVTAIIGIVIDLFADIYEFHGLKLLEPFKILLGIGICYLTISTVLQTQDDFRLVIPYIEFAKKIRGVRPLLIDTSILIDARIIELAETGFFQAPLLIPRFVIDELQRLADSSDKTKRVRGRRGLDSVSRLQRSALTEVSIEESMTSNLGVDQAIVELALSLPGSIITTDSGLQRVASIQGVPVLNLHEVYTALKPGYAAGDTAAFRIVRRGEQPGQGVGFLEDGTMVVVEDGEASVGSEVQATITSSMQTSAGRLFFARINPLVDRNPPDEPVDEPPTSAQQTPRDPAPASPDAPLGPPRIVRPGPAPRPADPPARSMRNPRRGA